jgi:hypothetical protein
LLKGDQGWQGEPGANAGYAIAVPLGLFARSAEGVDAILRYPKDKPIPLPPEAWPMLVIFEDITRPETVRRVDPADLAGVFGEGVRLESVRLEITEAAVSESNLQSLLGWWETFYNKQLDGDRYGNVESKYPFANSLNRLDLSSEP